MKIISEANLWSNDRELIQLAIDNPDTLNERLRKFLKNLFPKNFQIKNENEQIFNNLNEFYSFIQRIADRNEMNEFLNYTIDLMTGHSKIREIFLQSISNDVRFALVKLFYLLCTSCLEHCKTVPNLIDFVFSSYHATLSLEDQTLLKLLFILETNGFNMQKYHPFIWGESAAKFYAAKHSQKLPFLYTPKIDEIFQNFNNNHIFNNSISCFPIEITMNDDEESIEIIEDIEMMNRYDPRFVLRMFYHFLSVQSIVKYHKFINYGCLAYTIVSLSSFCAKIRELSYRILARFLHHLDCAKYPEDKQLWIGFIDHIRSGMQEENERINCCHTVLMAKCIEILLNPTCLLFPTIRNYLIRSQLKQINYRSMPMNLYRSCMTNLEGNNPISYMLHHKFIINWMIDSIRTKDDLYLWHKHKLINEMLIFYNSTLCSNEIKPLIMKLLLVIAKLIEGVEILCKECSIFAWINHQLIIQPHYDSIFSSNNNYSSKDVFYKLLTTIWNTSYQNYRQQNDSNNKEFILYETFSFELVMLLSKIIYKVNDYERIKMFVNICRKSLKSSSINQQNLIKKLIICNLPLNLHKFLPNEE